MIHDEIKCLGFFGFGGGYLIGQKRRAEAGSIYCGERCPKAQACWEAHLKRVKQLFPDMYAAEEELLKKGTFPEIKAEWDEVFGKDHAPCGMVVMMGNLEDGMAVGAGATPKDRGPFTLVYPFDKVDA